MTTPNPEFKSWMATLIEKGMQWSMEHADVTIEQAVRHWCDHQMWRDIYDSGESVDAAFDMGVEMFDEMTTMDKEEKSEKLV